MTCGQVGTCRQPITSFFNSLAGDQILVALASWNLSCSFSHLVGKETNSQAINESEQLTGLEKIVALLITQSPFQVRSCDQWGYMKMVRFSWSQIKNWAMGISKTFMYVIKWIQTKVAWPLYLLNCNILSSWARDFNNIPTRPFHTTIKPPSIVSHHIIPHPCRLSSPFAIAVQRCHRKGSKSNQPFWMWGTYLHRGLPP